MLLDTFLNKHICIVPNKPTSVIYIKPVHTCWNQVSQTLFPCTILLSVEKSCTVAVAYLKKILTAGQFSALWQSSVSHMHNHTVAID